MESLFVRMLGNSPALRLIDFFIGSPDFDFSMTEISKDTGISWVVLERIIPEFLNAGVIKETRQVGKSKMFMLNEENEISKYLIGMDKIICTNHWDNAEVKTGKMISRT
ncbi:MAG: hypothetical protein J4473_02250 [Candidatus Aenigmarchaeota archaeon]|nr:hypothetical protein [Candidatus Aenigmarchaeota archaeon]